MGKLTDVQLREWIKSGKPIVGKSDGDGLTFTLSRRGTAAWVLRYRYAGKQCELSLGRYPDISLKAARKWASEERVRIASGVDVAFEKRREKITLVTAGTFKELAEDYVIRVLPSLALSTQKETERFLKKDIIPHIGSLRLRDLTATEIVHLIEVIAKRSPSVARRTFEIVSVIFSHGIAKHIVQTNPCSMLKVSSIVGVQKKRRERIKLSMDEIHALFSELPALGIENALAIKILLATCVRKSELILTKWEHIDFGKKVWVIPDEHSKSRKGFCVPLATRVAGWFLELRDLAGESEYVLPSRKNGRKSLNNPICCNTLNAAINRLEGDIRHFSPHDLRSTARSHLAEVGVDIIVAERCLNHSLGGLVAVYDRHDYMEERRKALELWAKLIESAEKPKQSNIVPFKEARAVS